jgi:hypothetical protein
LYLFGPLFYTVAEPVSENGGHESR